MICGVLGSIVEAKGGVMEGWVGSWRGGWGHGGVGGVMESGGGGGGFLQCLEHMAKSPPPPPTREDRSPMGKRLFGWLQHNQGLLNNEDEVRDNKQGFWPGCHGGMGGVGGGENCKEMWLRTSCRGGKKMP